MECEKCGFEKCTTAFFPSGEIGYNCPRCKKKLIPSSDHLLYMKLKKNLTLEIKETFTNYFEFILKYNGNEITTATVELPIHKVY